MTALIDIQKALNAIRRITQQEVEAVRLEALALMAGVIADEAKDIEKRLLLLCPNPSQRRSQHQHHKQLHQAQSQKCAITAPSSL